MEFVHAVFNDMVDAMAKAEAGIGEVSRKESVNLMHVIPKKHFKIETRNKSEQDGNKKKVRELLQLVLEKNGLGRALNKKVELCVQHKKRENGIYSYS